MPSDYTEDAHALPQEPGAKVNAGTAGKQKAVARKTFNESIGHGAASGGAGQMNGMGGTGDPTINYPTASTWARSLGKAGKAGTPYHNGKQPVDYEPDLSTYMDEY